MKKTFCLALLAWAGTFAHAYDEELAKRLGANDNGLRAYVLVILKTGPNRVPAGAARDRSTASTGGAASSSSR